MWELGYFPGFKTKIVFVWNFKIFCVIWEGITRTVLSYNNHLTQYIDKSFIYVRICNILYIFMDGLPKHIVWHMIINVNNNIMTYWWISRVQYFICKGKGMGNEKVWYMGIFDILICDIIRILYQITEYKHWWSFVPFHTLWINNVY